MLLVVRQDIKRVNQTAEVECLRLCQLLEASMCI